jgi:hypothetical protein
MAAKGAVLVRPMTWKSGGIMDSWSPCDIQTLSKVNLDFKRQNENTHLHLIAESFKQGINWVSWFTGSADLKFRKPVFAMIAFCYLSLVIPANLLGLAWVSVYQDAREN